MYNIHKSGGPAVWREKDGTYRGACTRKFSSGLIYCIELSGDQCHADRRSGPRDVPNGGTPAPDWCPYLAGMIRDAQFMDMMRGLGLRAHIKADLLKMVRAMPDRLRPKKARELSPLRLQNIIFDAITAGWEPRL